MTPVLPAGNRCIRYHRRCVHGNWSGLPIHLTQGETNWWANGTRSVADTVTKLSDQPSIAKAGCLQIVEISARYDDACFPGTVTNAEREGLLMQVCLTLQLPTSLQARPATHHLLSPQAYQNPLTAEQALACRAPPTMIVPKLMRAPIFIYYQLDNYHQNHRRCLPEMRTLYFACQLDSTASWGSTAVETH